MIIVHIPADAVADGYVEYSVAAMHRLARSGEEIRYWRHPLVKSGTGAADDHAQTCGAAFADTVNDPEAMHVICDSDTVVVAEGWDAILKRVLETVDCFGTAYQRIGTLQTGTGIKQTYKGKPNVQWMALAPGKSWHLFVPQKTNFNLYKVTGETATIWNLPSGNILLQDACWNFPLFLQEHGLSCLAMEQPVGPIALANMQHNYEEWTFEGAPFVIHQGKSRKNAFRDTEFSKRFYQRADELLGLGQSTVNT